LSRPSDSWVRVWRIDIQAEVWASRREPTGERFEQRQSGNHSAKSRVRRRSRLAAVQRKSDAHKFERRHGRRNAAHGITDLQRAISSRSRARSPRRVVLFRSVCGTDREGKGGQSLNSSNERSFAPWSGVDLATNTPTFVACLTQQAINLLF